MDTGEVKILNCPFCKNEVKDLRAEIASKEMARFSIRCSSCGAIGPVGIGKPEEALRVAVSNWNQAPR